MAAEAYLDLLGVAYTVEHCTSPEQSPSGALPAVLFDDEPVPGCQTAHGHALGHAARVATLQHVAASVADLDGPLSSGDKAHSAAFCALLDACVTPALIHAAWNDPTGFAKHTRPGFGTKLPHGASRWVTARWRGSQLAQGASLKGPTAWEDATGTAARCLATISGRLGSAGGYLLGAEPCAADALLLAHLAYIQRSPTAPSALREAVKRDGTLTRYMDGASRKLQRPLFTSLQPGPRTGMPPLRRPSRTAQGGGSASSASASGQPKSGVWGALSERRKSQLSVVAALTSCAAYVLFNDLIDISFEYDDDDEPDVDDEDEGDDAGEASGEAPGGSD